MPIQVVSGPKSPSMSSVRSKASKTSIKSDSGSIASVKNEATAEVHHSLCYVWALTLLLIIILFA